MPKKSIEKQQKDIDLKNLQKNAENSEKIDMLIKLVTDLTKEVKELKSFVMDRIPIEDQPTFWKNNCLHIINGEANKCNYPTAQELKQFAKKKLIQKQIPKNHPRFEEYVQYIVKMGGDQRSRKKSELKLSIAKVLKEVLLDEWNSLDDITEFLEDSDKSEKLYDKMLVHWNNSARHLLFQKKDASALSALQKQKMKIFATKALNDRKTVLLKMGQQDELDMIPVDKDDNPFVFDEEDVELQPKLKKRKQTDSNLLNSKNNPQPTKKKNKKQKIK